MNLARAEQYLRRDDKALRLRESQDHPGMILVERKTFRGRIGATCSLGRDEGRCQEEGHRHVCSLPALDFSPHLLREALQASDSWKTPGWIDELERRERVAKEHRRQSRLSDLRYKGAAVFDRYAWQSKSRIVRP